MLSTEKTIPPLMRVAAAAAGLGCLAAAGYAQIERDVPWHQVSAMLVGVAVIALLVPSMWRKSRLLAVVALSVAMAGECYNFLASADRIVSQREAQQAPLRAAAQRHADAKARLAKAEAAFAAAPETSARLKAADERLRWLEATAADRAAQSGCRQGCIASLDGDKAAARQEIAAARQEIEHRRAGLEADLASARTALAAAPLPPSESAFANRIGAPAWAFDIALAGLFALGLNGAGIVLLGFAGHGLGRRGNETVAGATETGGAAGLPTVAPPHGASSPTTEPMPQPAHGAVMRGSSPAPAGRPSLTLAVSNHPRAGTPANIGVGDELTSSPQGSLALARKLIPAPEEEVQANPSPEAGDEASTGPCLAVVGGRVADFISANLARSVGSRVSASDLYSAYVAWAKVNEAEPVHQQQFGRELTGHGFIRRKLHPGVQFYVDVVLAPAHVSGGA